MTSLIESGGRAQIGRFRTQLLLLREEEKQPVALQLPYTSRANTPIVLD